MCERLQAAQPRARRRRERPLLGLLALFGVLGLGCAEERPAAQAPFDACAEAAQRLEECGLAEQSCETDQERCFARCQTHMDCTALEDPNTDPGAIACWYYCAPRFECDDGQQILMQWVCDDVVDCADGSDEVLEACG